MSPMNRLAATIDKLNSAAARDNAAASDAGCTSLHPASHPLHGQTPKTPVLDPCCGSRMFWFDRKDKRVTFGDIRNETHQLKDKSSKGGFRELSISPDQRMDFRELPFEDDSFYLVSFDPPHLVKAGKSGWLAKKYGKLGRDWRSDLSAGFSECFRVLKPNGTLVFKWNENDVKVSEVLALTDNRPLFGNRCGKHAKSHWLVFMKPDEKHGQPEHGAPWSAHWQADEIKKASK